MVGEVNKIIYNMLVSGKGVFLPSVGTLYIERRGARKISETRLVSPHNVISYSSQEQAPSLVSEIVSIAGCEQAQAQDIYDRWLSKTLVEGRLTIEGVGVLVGKAFTVDPALGKAINPQGIKTLVVRRKKSGAWIYVVCAISIALALGFFAYIMWGDKASLSADEKPLVTEQTEVIPAMEIVPADSIAKSEVAVEQPAVEPKEQPAEAVVAVAKDYAYYVVMGIFSTEENANRAVEQVEKKIEDPQCKILPFKNKFMVTIYGSDTVGDCNAYAKSYHDIYPDLWVYARK
ncbi:MAG: hypothetical protein IKM69_05960 [Alistipes sp.]|nr:hypothetical protein [Alistipes sp.]